jgi:hypothetical protein
MHGNTACAVSKTGNVAAADTQLLRPTRCTRKRCLRRAGLRDEGARLDASVGFGAKKSVFIPSALPSRGVPDGDRQVKAKSSLDPPTTARQRKHTPGQTG